MCFSYVTNDYSHIYLWDILKTLSADFAAADRNLTQHHNLPRQGYTDKYLGAGACKRYLNNKISVDRKKDTPFL